MTSILTDCAKDIVGRVINLIIDESRNVCCFKCIVDDFEKEKPELEAKWRSISKDIEDAERRAEDILEDVTHWQVEAKKLIDEDTKTKVSCFGGWCPNCIWRYKRGKQLTQITNDVRTLKAFNFQSVGRPPHLPDVEIHSSQGFIPFESRDSEYKQLLDAIADENNYITGLQGMGGAGKTTLAKEVGRKLEESGKFDSVVFATVSNNPDIKKIQDSIAGPLGLSLKDMDEWTRRSTILKRLTDGKNILIILDDVWEQINFGEIGIPSGDSHKNCRVLLTSRDVRVCKSMGCSRPTQLALLSDQDAWILFKKHSGIDDSFPKSFQDKGQEITKECKNLPVAIAAIASSLKLGPIEEWDVALTALQNPTPMLDVDENLRKTYEVLRYSYDNMKSDKAKTLFLLLSLFPEDYEIPTELLTRIGIGAGLLGEVGRYCEGRSQLLALRTKLIHSCLWLETEDRHVKLHDLVREVALWIANGDIQSIQLSESNRKALAKKEKNVRYLFCYDFEVRDMDEFPRWFDASQLEILIICMEVTDSVKVSGAFFEKMTRLRVLLLQNNNISRFALTLPISLRSLSNIRSLSLMDWNLGSISILGILQTLENLHLSGCSISELPNEITKLEKLRLLQLVYCEIEKNNPFEVIGRCSQLEELYFSDNYLSVLYTVNEVEAIHQNTTFPKLNRYHLEKDDEMDDSVSKIVCLPKIEALVSEATFKYLVEGAEILQLSEIVGEWRNLIPEIVPMEDNGMNDLIELSLMFCSKVKCLVNTEHSDCGVPNVFSKLVSLNLEDMDNLEDLCIGPLPLEFLKSLERLNLGGCVTLQGMLFKGKLNLCNLKIMQVGGCPILTSLFQPSTARSLVLLEELRIWKCEELANIITGEELKDEEEEERIDGNKGYDTMFPKLKILQIEDCRQLECISPILLPQDIPLLETMEIDGCGEMKYIFGGWEQEEDEVIVGSLQETHPSQECYPHTSSSRNGSKGKQQNSTNSKIFPWLCICRFHKKYGSKLRSVTNVKMPTGSIPGQVIVDMRDDEERKNCIPIFSKSKKIIIMNCYKLKYVIGPNRPENHNHEYHMDFPALEELVLGFLPNMINICPKNYFITLPSLKKFRLDDKCSQISSDSDLVVSLYSGQLINTTNKDTGEIGKHFLTLESLCIKDSKVESIFHLDGFQIVERPSIMALQYLELENLPQMTNICVASENSFTFQHLQTLLIVGCAKLEVIFPISVVRCLPELEVLEIIECKELKKIIEEDVENEKVSPQPCFPKLVALVVRQCHKLKCFIASNDLPNLQLLIINGASKLEELTGCEQRQGNDEIRRVQAMFPKLEAVIFMNLSSLCLEDGTLQTIRHRVVHNCPKLSLTSTTSLMEFKSNVFCGNYLEDRQINRLSWSYILEVFDRGTQEVTTDYLAEPETQRGSGSKLPSSQTNEEPKEEWDPMTKTTSQPSATSESELPSLQVNDANQSIVGNFSGTVHESKIAPHLQSLEEKPSSFCSPSSTESNEATVEECAQEVFNLTSKEEEIGVISADNIVMTQRNEEEPKKEFIGIASISEMPAISASTKDTDMIKGSYPNLSTIPLPKIHSNSIKRGVEEGGTSENAKMETLSTRLKPVISQPGSLVTPQQQSHPHSEIRLNQTETYANKQDDGHPINIQELRDNDLMSLFQPKEEDNLVVKVLADLEESLKMPLKDIACYDTNSLRLLTALNFLSRLSLEHVTISEGLNAIIGSLHNEFPSILRSFKQACAVLEEKEKSIKEELAKISKAKYFMDEAQKKEAMLKERMNRLEKEMKDCEADLSSLQEEKKKFVAETMGYEKEFETVGNDKSQMMEDQRKARHKLLEIDYQWSILCSQFENSLITANNPS